MLRSVLPLLLTGLIANGCKKAQENNRDTTTAEDNAQAVSLWDDVGNQSEGTTAYSETGTANASKYGNCATVSIDSLPGAFPMTITVDFGETNCKGPDGRMRRGKLISTITGPYRLAGSMITTTPSDYYVDDYRVEGTRKATNKGYDGDSNMVFNIMVTDAVITSPENETVQWNSQRTRTWTEGIQTGFFTKDTAGNFLGMDGIRDDVYEITGTADGIDRKGRSFSVDITKALRIELDCRWIVEGMLEIVPEGLEKRTVDYGSGACDNDAEVTIKERTFKIQLRG